MIMASMVAWCRTPLPHSINKPSLLLKPPSPILYFRSKSSPFLHTNSHFLKHNRLSSHAPVIRATFTNHAFYSTDTDKLPSDVRNRTLDAVDLCARRVTVVGVAAKAGIKVDEAQKALQTVAADSDSYLDGNGMDFEEKRWKLIGQYIASIGGATTAEELAPYLDVTTKAQKNDEGYILPVLIRFDGHPEVDEEGNILYQFPSLQRTASSDRRGKSRSSGTDKVVPIEKFPRENYWNFSNTNMYQKLMVSGLAVLNNLGVFILGGLFRDKEVTKIGFIKFMSYTFPLLQIYAVSYFVIPFFRGIFILKINADIKKRNQAREQHALGLEHPDVTLRWKLQSACDMAERSFVGNSEVVYSTKGESIDQSLEAIEWDQKLSRGRKSKVKEIIELANRKSIGNNNVVYSFGQDLDAKELEQKILETNDNGGIQDI